jgi:hypothetical protein
MKKGAVLVETRLLPDLMKIIENHLLFLPEDWGFMMFGSKENEKWFHDHFPDCPFVTLGNKDLQPKDYNIMLTSKWFWEKIPFDKILIFQHDSRLLKEGIEEFLQWDYVGAPWKFQHHGGNGGLSLRTKAAMIDIIERNTPYYETYPDEGNEDVWFCNKLKYYSIHHPDPLWKLAPRDICTKFCVESIYEMGTLGVHAIENYLTPLECNSILNQYTKK